MSVSNPVLTYIQLMGTSTTALTGVAGSSFVTATFQITAGWELRIPYHGVQASNVSAGPEVAIYEMVCDGTVAPKYATIPTASLAITRAASGADVAFMRIDAGIYCARLCSGGPNTATVGLLTGAVFTGISNV